MKGKNILSVLLAAALLAACTNDDNTYSNYHCNLYIDNSTHQDAT